ncbi:MAG: FmdE family protein [Candidatus Thermoplasmatota archaeon]|nr:FmdE family protein [Candidatus Thermoplasmatota archaeon]
MTNLEKMLIEAGRFHGHICPGLAIGVVASYIALRDARRSDDEELVAIVENDACGVDAIQHLTGCTFGKGNLVFRDHGKSVYTFLNRATGKALRLSLDHSAIESSLHDRELFESVRNGTATPGEIDAFHVRWEERAREVLYRAGSLFKVDQVDIAFPEKARIHDNITCDKCKEQVMATRIVETEQGRKFCIPCSEEKKEKEYGK